LGLELAAFIARQRGNEFSGGQQKRSAALNAANAQSDRYFPGSPPRDTENGNAV
jgi:hypothetical protein